MICKQNAKKQPSVLAPFSTDILLSKSQGRRHFHDIIHTINIVSGGELERANPYVTHCFLSSRAGSLIETKSSVDAPVKNSLGHALEI